MKNVLEWRADLKEKQAEYVGEGDCPLCKKPIQSRPLFMVGKYDMCYSCFRDLELAGIRPPERVADLIIDVSPLDKMSIQDVIQR